MTHVSITARGHPDGGRLVFPAGLATPHGSLAVRLQDGDQQHEEAATGQVLIARPLPPGVGTVVDYDAPDEAAPYPAAMFAPRDSRFTRAAPALANEARRVAQGDDPVAALANHVAGLFRYGHPETRFYDGQDHIPQVCGLAEGSCVDINAYFMAGLRAVGVEAGYLTGYFFPAEKTGADGSAWCNDAHCWVVTRDAHGLREWDIAHHLKAALSPIGPALNPKPGKRFPLAHSMGLTFPGLGLQDIKLVSEPMWLAPGELTLAGLDIRLHPASLPPRDKVRLA